MSNKNTAPIQNNEVAILYETDNWYSHKSMVLLQVCNDVDGCIEWMARNYAQEGQVYVKLKEHKQSEGADCNFLIKEHKVWKP